MSAEKVDYRRDIKPILITHCSSCHGALKQEADLRLDAASLIRKGGQSGPAIVAGKPQQSLILDALLGRNSRTAMPPKGAGRRLTSAEIKKIQSWIRQGAAAPREAIPTDPRKHWSYQLPTLSRQLSSNNPVDAYFRQLHKKHKLAPRPVAKPTILLRRMHLDLVGLPPTPAEVRRFSQDPSGKNVERLVDRLLASPHYGERWGRHWMDVWRYTDWFGLGKEVRYSQKHIWRWRDWIVRSLNGDKGYDQMVVEMLAADELYPLDRQRIAATGFLARNWYLFNRNFWLDDVVHHTSKAFLGLTANCARCHDHKYDPVSQREYYQLRAFFEPHRVRLDTLPHQPDKAQDGLPRVFDKDLTAKTYLFLRGDENSPDRSQVIKPRTPAVIGDASPKISEVRLPLLAYYPGLQPERIRHQRLRLNRQIKAARKQRTGLAKEIATTESKLARLTQPSLKKKAKKQKSIPATGVLFDQFRSPRPKLWKRLGGKATYSTNGVVHENLSGGQSRFVSLRQIPGNFAASLTFEMLAGKTRSIGMAFDLDKRGLFGVFASPSGSKVQIYMILDGRESYPAGAIRSVPVPNAKKLNLSFAVRGQDVNVWFNGRLVIVHRLQQPRRHSGFALTCYQAKVRFSALRVDSLKSSFRLAKSVGQATRPPFSPLPPPSDADSLKAALAVKKAQLSRAGQLITVIQLERAALDRREQAERARHGLDQGDQASLARTAALAESQAQLARARFDISAASAILAASASATQAKTKARNLITNANKRIAAAQAKISKKSSQYSTFGSQLPQTSTGRRLALARWITSRRNPLTARVAVNHIWTRHFGQPLVESLFDFGLRSAKPQHQELLDHLAHEFMARKWSMKWLHRTILLSQTYQRSSTATDSTLIKRDPDNRLYWRMNTLRMQAEVIRDSMVHLAGQLDRTVGGPDIPNVKTEKGKRRTIYYRYARSDRYNLFDVFDGPSVEECYRRRETIVPHQSLALVNGSLATHWSQQIADNILTHHQRSYDIVVNAFERILGRSPTQEERRLSLLALAELTKSSSEKNRKRAAVKHLVHVLLNHNDFITIR